MGSGKATATATVLHKRKHFQFNIGFPGIITNLVPPDNRIRQIYRSQHQKRWYLKKFRGPNIANPALIFIRQFKPRPVLGRYSILRIIVDKVVNYFVMYCTVVERLINT